MIDMNAVVGNHDLLFVTLDTLRYDVAAELAAAGPHAARWPGCCPAARGSGGTRRRASPTPPTTRSSPASCPPRPRRARTRGCSPPASRAARPPAARHLGLRRPRPGRPGSPRPGYHTVCVGGVGFFNKRTPLGSRAARAVRREPLGAGFGVTDPRLARRPSSTAAEPWSSARRPDRPLFLFLNVSALHQPNRHYLPGATRGQPRQPRRRAGVRRPPPAAGCSRWSPAAAGRASRSSAPTTARRTARTATRPPGRPRGRVDRAVRRVHPPSGTAMRDRRSTGSPVPGLPLRVSAQDGVPAAAAPAGAARRLGRRAARRAVPLPARAVLRDALRLLQPVHPGQPAGRAGRRATCAQLRPAGRRGPRRRSAPTPASPPAAIGGGTPTYLTAAELDRAVRPRRRA